MADRVVLSAEYEVLPVLQRLELDRGKLIDVVRIAAGERALCTRNDIRGFDLITMNGKVIRGLRDNFCGEDWVNDETDNQEGIFNRRLNIRVIACNFNHHTSNENIDHTNLVRKGSASDKKARCNMTGWLFGLPDIPVQNGSKVKTWILGSHVDADEVLRAELSLPLDFANQKYSRFETRIILLDGSENDSRDYSRIVPDRDGPVEEVDIAIRRK